MKTWLKGGPPVGAVEPLQLELSETTSATLTVAIERRLDADDIGDLGTLSQRTRADWQRSVLIRTALQPAPSAGARCSPGATEMRATDACAPERGGRPAAVPASLPRRAPRAGGRCPLPRMPGRRHPPRCGAPRPAPPDPGAAAPDPCRGSPAGPRTAPRSGRHRATRGR